MGFSTLGKPLTHNHSFTADRRQTNLRRVTLKHGSCTCGVHTWWSRHKQHSQPWVVFSLWKTKSNRRGYFFLFHLTFSSLNKCSVVPSKLASHEIRHFPLVSFRNHVYLLAGVFKIALLYHRWYFLFAFLSWCSSPSLLYFQVSSPFSCIFLCPPLSFTAFPRSFLRPRSLPASIFSVSQ